MTQPTGNSSRVRRALNKGARKVVAWSERTSAEAKRALRPLTAEFKPDQHQDYVDHLNAALLDDSIRNVALTGRYGSGKSSVLEEFARQNRKRVLFLSLSTLGPEQVEPEEDADGQDLAQMRSEEFSPSRVDRIQKELVKQLLHRERPANLPQSRYQRIDRLSFQRAFGESALFLGMVVIGLWLFDALPVVPRFTSDDSTWLRWPAAVLASFTVIYLVAWLRRAVHNRLDVSQVSAAGASVTLSKRSESYFDRYLDEIVYFFESRQAIDIVVFEDLDRFNQAGIFEALRELNTLLNNSTQITWRPLWRKGRRTIRFVYALRDSIFEQLGHDTNELEDDAAQAEAVRANRTKFFDLVVPLVPFITHRTSRELLARVLTSDELAAVPAVSDELVDLAARHIPDMRLLTNIRNEFSVFANRLITDGHGMDTLAPDQLMAMVVYKNLHLEDFELLLLGRSDLDAVYRQSRRLVNENIDVRRARLRQVNDNLAIKQAVTDRARSWGQKLDWFYGKVSEATIQASVITYVVEGTDHDPSESGSIEFWQEVLDANSGLSAVVRNRRYSESNDVSLGMAELRDVVGDSLRAETWTATAEEELRREQASLVSDLEDLRTADFADLARRSDFTLTTGEGPRPFSALVREKIDSELGQALILDGYIDRYYNMCIAQYYGERVPPNAMSYIVQNVDTNRTDVNYAFDSPEEIEALLAETKRSFLTEASGYNIAILDYLLGTKDDGAGLVLDTVIRHIGEAERAFLDAYLVAGVRTQEAVAYLAVRWPAIFTELVEAANLPDSVRAELVDVALASSTEDVTYELGDAVRAYFQANYRRFSTIVEPPLLEEVVEVPTEDEVPTPGAVHNAVATLSRAGFECDDLAVLRESAKRLVVERDSYLLSRRNLANALGDTASLSMDSIRSIDEGIYQDLLEHPDEYLRALDEPNTGVDEDVDRGPAAVDEMTRWTVRHPGNFASVLIDAAALTSQQVEAIVGRSHPDCLIENLSEVPDRLWEHLAEHRRFPMSLANVDVYVGYLGEVDASLAASLTASPKIIVPERAATSEEPHDEEEPDVDGAPTEVDEIEAVKIRVAEMVLTAAEQLPDPALRARLVTDLELRTWFPVAKISPEKGPMLGHLLIGQICKDSAETFAHFPTDDWDTLSFGIKHSPEFGKFVTPDLLTPPMTAILLSSSDITPALKAVVLERFDEFVPIDDSTALAAAARASMAVGLFLGASRITAIAHGTGDGALATRLVHRFRDEMTTEEALDAVLQAGGPYSLLSTTGDKLTFPRDTHHEAVLQRLKADGRINSRAHSKSMLKEARIEVEVL